MNSIGRMRVYKGIGQKEFADKLKCTLGTVQRYERVHPSKIKYGRLMKMCEVLGITTERLFSDEL
jgi:transcriptional regulator with XRE-family HTH domain